MKKQVIQLKPQITQLTKMREHIDNTGMVHVYHPTYETYDYDVFKFLAENRETSKQHVKNVGDSISKIGLVQPIVVALYNLEYLVVDGQHRFKSLQQKGLPIEFVLVRLNNFSDVIQLMINLNNSQRSWSLGQYVLTHSKSGKNKDSYRRILECKSCFTNSTTAAILANISVNLAKHTIKNGTYMITDIELGMDRFNHFNAFFTHTEMNCGQRAVEGFIQFVNDIEFSTYKTIHNKYIEKVSDYIKKGNPEFFKQNMGEREYALLFTEVYRMMKK